MSEPMTLPERYNPATRPLAKVTAAVAAMTMSVPGGNVIVPQMPAGMIHWRNGEVRVDASGMLDQPSVVGGILTEPESSASQEEAH